MSSYSNYTAEDLQAIDKQIKALSTGQSVSEYEIRGRRVKYQNLTLEELQRLRRTIEQQLGGGKKRNRYKRIVTSKGF